MGEGWGPFRSSAKNYQLGTVSAKHEAVIQASTSLVESCSLERLIDVAALAPDGPSDLSGAHSFLA